ncbi:MAG: Cache 3/Cache 2 fusion domain-containing protein, partial [Bacteroidota bacterium]|nr:Cache 3/Cache 2 fusion domain-containing protein [Bacteroidota bacterium]
MSNIHSLSYKTGLFTGILILLFISSLSIIGYYIQKEQVVMSSDSLMTNKVKKLSNTIDLQIKDRQKNVNTAMNLAHNIFYSSGGVIEGSHENIEMIATNQISKQTHNVNLKSWYNSNNPIHNNFIIVDSIKKLSVETVTIFQKIDSGYLRISTNVMKLNNTRAIGTYIPNSSIVIKTVESGKTYTGRAFVVNAWYLTAYEPIYINDKIKGILYVGVKEKNFTDIEKLFLDKKHKSLKLNLATKNKQNKIIINSKDSILNKLLQKKLFKNGNEGSQKFGHFVYTNTENIKKDLYYNYNKATESYIVLTVDNDELNSSLDGLLALNITIGIII